MKLTNYKDNTTKFYQIAANNLNKITGTIKIRKITTVKTEVTRDNLVTRETEMNHVRIKTTKVKMLIEVIEMGKQGKHAEEITIKEAVTEIKIMKNWQSINDSMI